MVLSVKIYVANIMRTKIRSHKKSQNSKEVKYEFYSVILRKQKTHHQKRHHNKRYGPYRVIASVRDKKVREMIRLAIQLTHVDMDVPVLRAHNG